MTVKGHDIIKSCRQCFLDNGYGIRLESSGNHLVCTHDASHRYVVEQGFLKRV